MRPRMIVVAGPPGSGKSSLFSPYRLGIDAFVADDRAAKLNLGSYQGISPAIRRRVNREFDRFIKGHIQAGRSFAFETTLRTTATLSQAREARARGFLTVMRYVAVADPGIAVQRVIARAKAGGHSAPSSVIRATYAASLANLRDVLREFDSVRVYDNSITGEAPKLVLRTRQGQVAYRVPVLPAWLEQAAAVE